MFVPERPITKGIGHHNSEMKSAAATLASKMFVGVNMDLVLYTMAMTKLFPVRPTTTMIE